MPDIADVLKPRFGAVLPAGRGPESTPISNAAGNHFAGDRFLRDRIPISEQQGGKRTDFDGRSISDDLTTLGPTRTANGPGAAAGAIR
jgi:hypothetical protein